jgi:hypothetical protein
MPTLYAPAPAWARMGILVRPFPMVKFLVLALFYGDHPQLAQRCGSTLRALWNTGRVDVRVGLNDVSARSRKILEDLLPGVPMTAASPQIYKFPMNRRLLQTYQGDATHMMWFDDDSCLLPGVNAAAWLDAITQRAAQARGSLGSTYSVQLTPAFIQWIAGQPWYTGREVPRELRFTTGGFTVAPLDLLRRCDWPNVSLLHHGGDVSLGALLHQQGLEPEQFRVGLAINADENLRESEARRRGLTEAPGSTTPLIGMP